MPIVIPAKKLTRKSMNSLRQKSVVYPIGEAFIEFLMEKKGGDTLKLLLKEQIYGRLLEWYGEELIKAFEERIHHASSK